MPEITLYARVEDLRRARIAVTADEFAKLSANQDPDYANELAGKYGAIWESESIITDTICTAYGPDGEVIFDE